MRRINFFFVFTRITAGERRGWGGGRGSGAATFTKAIAVFRRNLSFRNRMHVIVSDFRLSWSGPARFSLLGAFANDQIKSGACAAERLAGLSAARTEFRTCDSATTRTAENIKRKCVTVSGGRQDASAEDAATFEPVTRTPQECSHNLRADFGPFSSITPVFGLKPDVNQLAFDLRADCFVYVCVPCLRTIYRHEQSFRRGVRILHDLTGKSRKPLLPKSVPLTQSMRK